MYTPGTGYSVVTESVAFSAVMNRYVTTRSNGSPGRRKPRLFSGLSFLPQHAIFPLQAAQLFPLLGCQALALADVNLRLAHSVAQGLVGNTHIPRNSSNRLLSLPNEMDGFLFELRCLEPGVWSLIDGHADTFKARQYHGLSLSCQSKKPISGLLGSDRPGVLTIKAV